MTPLTAGSFPLTPHPSYATSIKIVIGIRSTFNMAIRDEKPRVPPHHENLSAAPSISQSDEDAAVLGS